MQEEKLLIFAYRMRRLRMPPKKARKHGTFKLCDAAFYYAIAAFFAAITASARALLTSLPTVPNWDSHFGETNGHRY